MNLYEHTIIARQDTTPAQIKNIKEKYSKIIEQNKGDLVQTQDWGLLNLSYLIKKNKKGNYIHFKIKGDGILIKELEKNERIDKNLLRFVTIKVKKFDLKENYFSKEEKDIEKKNKVKNINEK
ncbi:30S ribosomal protein S6 [Candidatus Pelagibacter communis]|uniref:30S ribosomal protein S6 n=1 Tax=Pelagibacter ubique TaxID=198252 RepID=UPI00094DB491|nr:30S ribosomal protein S6 [Candidatus Pelagibacter ubique]